MSEDQSVNSFGDPNAQPPPTPKQTPTSAAFPSPIFETPKPPQGSFAESSGQTPRYAEDYSVFNATPGNLRGTQNPFADFISADLIGSSLGHKRLLSAGEIAVEIASRGTFVSPYPNARLPPVDPSRRLPSSPAAFIFPKGPLAESELQLSPNLPPHGKSSKKVRRGTLTLPSSEATQVLSPPPSAHKGGKKLAPKPNNMQDDQQYGHQDYENLQAHEMAALMGHTGDMFGYPMSAPGGMQGEFWDPSSMSMDIDFGVTQTNFFQPSHRHTGSFDWNSEIQLFQDPVPPAPAPTTQDNAQPARRERALAPKPPASGQMMAPTTSNSAIPATYAAMDDPFGLMSPVDGVDPGLLYSRPPTSSMDAEFNHMVNPGSAEAAVLESHNLHAAGQLRRANTTKDTRKGKMPDRSFTNSPVKSNSRPGLERSMSDNRGRKASGRTLPALAPAARPTPQTVGSGNDASKAGAKPSGRISPVKIQRRLSSLASIPESISQPQLVRPRTSVRFTIDAHGRARAETTFLMDEAGSSGMTRSKSSRELSTRSGWNSSEDESTDEEPIIIPSRTNSFNTSFALPDPRKPVGSIFNSSRRSVSDRSTSASVNRDGSAGPLGEGESDAEMALAEHEKGGRGQRTAQGGAGSTKAIDANGECAITAIIDHKQPWEL
ncbi:hypothetical protein PT974_08184 [Cladobotryum mycophilum]|uniref:PHD finger domain protein n=1 Tax=Cladobotryum mycophilum TaxID=491253 RepID=A0ABR0SCN5_9HYPO